jgi:hypothetical protein
VLEQSAALEIWLLHAFLNKHVKGWKPCSQDEMFYIVFAYPFCQACDSLMNIGPCGQAVMGEPAFLSEEFHNVDETDLELVTTSGYGKNGAITVLQVRRACF